MLFFSKTYLFVELSIYYNHFRYSFFFEWEYFRKNCMTVISPSGSRNWVIKDPLFYLFKRVINTCKLHYASTYEIRLSEFELLIKRRFHLSDHQTFKIYTLVINWNIFRKIGKMFVKVISQLSPIRIETISCFKRFMILNTWKNMVKYVWVLFPTMFLYSFVKVCKYALCRWRSRHTLTCKPYLVLKVRACTVSGVEK